MISPAPARMRKVLFILSELLDEDVEWLANSGDRLRYPVGAELIPCGGVVDSIYFVLDGTFSVLRQRDLVTELHSGEVIGEMSLVDRPAPPPRYWPTKALRRCACHTPACATSSMKTPCSPPASTAR
jgi:CRP-like cAMP-binding protein